MSLAHGCWSEKSFNRKIHHVFYLSFMIHLSVINQHLPSIINYQSSFIIYHSRHHGLDQSSASDAISFSQKTKTSIASHKWQAAAGYSVPSLLGDSAAAWAAVVLICNSAQFFHTVGFAVTFKTGEKCITVRLNGKRTVPFRGDIFRG